MEFAHEESLGRDAAELSAEEHSGHEVEQERSVFLHCDGFLGQTVAVAVNHVALRREVDEVRTLLGYQRHEFAKVVGTFEERFLILLIVGHSTHALLVVLRVGVHHVDGDIHLSGAALELIAGSPVESLEQIHGILMREGSAKLVEVLLRRGDVARGDFLLRDGVETIEEVFGGSASVVALCREDALIELLSQLCSEVEQHLLRHVDLLEFLALCQERAVNGLPGFVGIEFLHDAAQENLQRARIDANARVVHTGRVVRTQFDVAAQAAHDHAAATAGEGSHVFEGFIRTDDGHDEEFFLILNGRFCQVSALDVECCHSVRECF